MGRGDKRTRKGKIARSSYGNSRPKTKKTSWTTEKSEKTSETPATAKS